MLGKSSITPRDRIAEADCKLLGIVAETFHLDIDGLGRTGNRRRHHEYKRDQAADKFGSRQPPSASFIFWTTHWERGRKAEKGRELPGGNYRLRDHPGGRWMLRWRRLWGRSRTRARMPAGARGFMAPKRRATTKAGRAGAQSPGRHLSAREVKKLIAQYSQSAFQPDTQNALRRDLNKAISDFQFRRSYAIAPTQAQFRKRFNGLHAALKRVKAKLPPADSQNDLFNYIRRLGEAYARVHGPHPHIEPRELSLRGRFQLSAATARTNRICPSDFVLDGRLR